MSRQPDRIRLRGHHLLCAFGFRGHGYSDEFVSNMRRVVDALFSRDGALFEIVSGCDDICRACPHEEGGRCTSDGVVGRGKQRDRAVLDALDLAPGYVGQACDVTSRVARLIDAGRLRSICAGCRWLASEYCERGLPAAGSEDRNSDGIEGRDVD